MRFWFSGPRMLGGLVRPGVSFGPEDFRRRQTRTQTQAAVQDFVYVVAGEHGLVKVGMSTDPEGRLANLQTASPHRLRLVFTAPAFGYAFSIEQAAHEILAVHRSSGEWFRVTPDMAVAALYAAADRTGYSLSTPPSAANPAYAGSDLAAATGRGAWFLKAVVVVSALFLAAWAMSFDLGGREFLLVGFIGFCLWKVLGRISQNYG